MFSHVIFDLDGTLLNTIDDLADAGNHVCAAHGWPVHPVDEYKRMVGSGIPNLVSRFAPEGTDGETLAQALAEFSAWYDFHKADKTAPYPGVPELLAALKGAGVRLAVLSNKAHALAGPVVEHYFPGVFEYVQGALPGAPLKPDPTLLRALMEQIGAKPETTLFVGDSDVDVLTGKNGGLTVVGVLWGFRDRQELEGAGADYIIDDPAQLPGLVNMMNRVKRFLFLAAELALWAVVAFLVFVSVVCFYTARQTPELWGYLAPDRLEEVQFKWIVAGVVFAVPALGAFAGAVGLEIHRRKKKGGRE